MPDTLEAKCFEFTVQILPPPLFYQMIQVGNIKGVHLQVAKIQGSEKLSLWQRLNSFELIFYLLICLSVYRHSFRFNAYSILISAYIDGQIWYWRILGVGGICPPAPPTPPTRFPGKATKIWLNVYKGNHYRIKVLISPKKLQGVPKNMGIQ